MCIRSNPRVMLVYPTYTRIRNTFKIDNTRDEGASHVLGTVHILSRLSTSLQMFTFLGAFVAIYPYIQNLLITHNLRRLPMTGILIPVVAAYDYLPFYLNGVLTGVSIPISKTCLRSTTSAAGGWRRMCGHWGRRSWKWQRAVHRGKG